MKVFLAGATGVLGKQLVPKLIERGHPGRCDHPTRKRTWPDFDRLERSLCRWMALTCICGHASSDGKST